MSNGRPNGKLTTGAVGSFLLGGALLIMLVSGFSLGGGGGLTMAGTRAVGGLMLLAALLLLAGTITQAFGWFGLGNLYGGVNGQAGFLDILVAAGMVIAVIAGVVGVVALAQIATYLILFGLPLAALVGGLGMIAAKGSAEQGGSTLQIGGIILAIGGGVMLVLVLLGLAQVAIGGLGEILGWIAIIGLTAGHIAAGAAMLGQRG